MYLIVGMLINDNVIKIGQILEGKLFYVIYCIVYVSKEVLKLNGIILIFFFKLDEIYKYYNVIFI